ncbi:hypothetical protein BDA96_02G274000 [Sorghum bicolor]|uniref:Uncharacterized protein n=1 Tax=Sorghum bicolor TaxID=4558 RepID=A0A921UTX7_SORBI|nr:hypothetical protein BDA96_02G274000 [Sorghum bicolor]
MRMCKAPELLKKAATVFKSKTDTLRTKLFILASLLRKMATVRTISRRIHALVSSDRENQARLEYGDKTLVLHKVAAGIQEPASNTDHDQQDGMIDLSEVAMFVEDDYDDYPDWTHSLFNDEYCNDDDDEEEGHCDDHGTLDALDEPSVMDIIRSNREVEGLEFNLDDEIDQACDMFIKRFRKRMNRSF